MSESHRQVQNGRALSIIGAGACSTIWTPEGSGPAFKFENEETPRSLYKTTRCIKELSEAFSVPQDLLEFKCQI